VSPSTLRLHMMNSFHMTMVLKYGVEEMSLSQTEYSIGAN